MIVTILLGLLLFWVLSREIFIFEKGQVWINDDNYTAVPIFYLRSTTGWLSFLTGFDIATNPPAPVYMPLIRIHTAGSQVACIVAPWLEWSFALVVRLGWPPVRLVISNDVRDWRGREVSDIGNEETT